MHFERESSGVARVNDNLFTALVRHAVPREFGCRLFTRFGPIRAGFRRGGLAELRFEDDLAPPPENDGAFRQAFLDWLSHFQPRPADERWAYLAPEGTGFQKKVWRALLDIPYGETVAYGEVAARIGRPNAHRAVGSAIGANPICLLIPCHRVVPAGGGVGGYRWGEDRKRALLDAESQSNSGLVSLFQ